MKTLQQIDRHARDLDPEVHSPRIQIALVLP